MAHIKNRTPEFLFVTQSDWPACSLQFQHLSKADWCDLYYDLYRQVFGEQAPVSEVMNDVSRRIEILKRYRKK